MKWPRFHKGGSPTTEAREEAEHAQRELERSSRQNARASWLVVTAHTSNHLAVLIEGTLQRRT